MKEEKFLPIGTVVMLKEGRKKVMVLSYLIFPTGEAEHREMYDYGGCAYPEGVVDSKVGIGFNHDQIEEVVHMGHVDDDYKELNETLKQYADDFKTIYSDSVKKEESEKKKESKKASKDEDKK